MIIELKIIRSRTWIAQLQMYVNYFDRTERLSHKTSTVDILLCLEKNDTVLKFTLPEDSNVIALTAAGQLNNDIKNEFNKQKQLGQE